MLTDVVAGQTVLNSRCVWDDLKHFPGLRFHVLIDGPNVTEFRRALPSFVEVKAVPRSFRATHARYKARVLEYFRRQELVATSLSRLAIVISKGHQALQRNMSGEHLVPLFLN